MPKGTTPEPCNSKIFKRGVSVAQIAQADGMRSWHIEEFVKLIASETKTATDWHYSGGIAQVLTLGDPKVVAAAITAKWPAFAAPYPNARCATGLPARYRADVDELPDGVIGVG